MPLQSNSVKTASESVLWGVDMSCVDESPTDRSISPKYCLYSLHGNILSNCITSDFSRSPQVPEDNWIY
jgi:hypothetical protein